MARALKPESERKRCYVYADEFQNIVTETFENLLSEARKYGLAMIMAHQYVGQLLPKVQSAVFGNVGSMIVFRVSGEDALKLKPELAPVAKVKDLINLGRREFYAKLLIDGESYDPFSAETLDVLPPNHESYREDILKASREKHSKQLEVVLQEIRAEEGLEETTPAKNNQESSIVTDATEGNLEKKEVVDDLELRDNRGADINSDSEQADELEPLI
jgi:hypothetical protein